MSYETVSLDRIPAERAPERGFTLTGVLLAIFIMAVLIGIALGPLSGLWRRSGLRATVETARTAIQQARLLSVFSGMDHFVVVDAADHLLEIYEDSAAPFNAFDAGDRLVSRSVWSSSIDLELPTTPTLNDPLLGTALSSAWALPTPDTSSYWGTERLGFRATPRGRLVSVDASPQTIGVGAILFHDGASGIAAVALDGRSGLVWSRHWKDGAWESF